MSPIKEKSLETLTAENRVVSFFVYFGTSMCNCVYRTVALWKDTGRMEECSYPTQKRPISTPALIKAIREGVGHAERKEDDLTAERELGMSV
jgi:hypothetical protein